MVLESIRIFHIQYTTLLRGRYSYSRFTDERLPREVMPHLRVYTGERLGPCLVFSKFTVPSLISCYAVRVLNFWGSDPKPCSNIHLEEERPEVFLKLLGQITLSCRWKEPHPPGWTLTFSAKQSPPPPHAHFY